ncbi:MAG: LuxR C-terminal-related transcriptional regulator [Gemmatimonadetes bacterium]|nr:LuxR C-terminal-related transcriptional regulator [Gemmatimonadota bacterium]
MFAVTSAELADHGRALLAEGRWSEASAAFTRALADAETPELLEGLSWAAWWLDDADTVFSARERAFRLYRRRRQPADAARMATWIAADQLDFRAAAAVAQGWFRRAHGLLDRLEPCSEHGWLAFHEGYVALAQGDLSSAAALAARTIDAGHSGNVPDVEMLGLALRGAVHVAAGATEEGMACLDEAAAAALGLEPTIPIAGAWACCFLVSACESVHDYARAFEWCDRIAEFAHRYGSRYMLAFCRAHYGMIHLWRGRWKDAESELVAAVEAYERARPPYVASVVASLAELRRRQGRFDDAERLLDNAGGGGIQCRALLAYDRGETLRAAELAERRLRQLPGRLPVAGTPSLELLVRARADRSEFAAAEAALDRLREIERTVRTVPLRAAADLAEGILATARGEHDHARRCLEDAVDRFATTGAPFEAARARIELARCLLALGRAPDAEREARAAIDTLAALGAEAELRRARALLAATSRRGPPALAGLTRRERQVLRLVAQGLANRQIARKLVISEHTVHRHVANILRKLGVASRTAAAAIAARFDLDEAGQV